MQRLGAAARCGGSVQRRLHAGRLMCDFHLHRDARSNTLSPLPLRSAPRHCSLLLSLCCACCRVKAVEWRLFIDGTWLLPFSLAAFQTPSFPLQLNTCGRVCIIFQSRMASASLVELNLLPLPLRNFLISLSSRQLPVASQPASHWLLEANKKLQTVNIKHVSCLRPLTSHGTNVLWCCTDPHTQTQFIFIPSCFSCDCLGSKSVAMAIIIIIILIISFYLNVYTFLA